MEKANAYKTSRGERLSYSSYFVGQNIIFMFVLQFLTIFYTDVIGLSAAAVGTLFLVARMWDAINDPILGAIVDKVHFKKGKFKPWINGVIFLMPIATIALFFNVGNGGTTSLVYAYITYILWGMIYTISDVPIFALATVMTDNMDERVKIISGGRLAAGIASMIAAVVAAPLIETLGWTSTVIGLMVISLITMIPIRFKVRERIVFERKETTTLKDMFRSVFKNKYLLIFFTAYIVMGSMNTSQIAAGYFARYALGNFGLMGLLSLAGMLPMLFIPILLPPLVRKFGKKKIYIGAATLAVVTSVAQYFIGYDSIGLLLLLNLIKGIGYITPPLMMGLFTTDCVEYGAFTTGVRNEGITFSVQTFSTKMGTALAAFIGTSFLTFYGYQPNVQQTSRTLEGLWKMSTLYPALGLVIAIIIIGLFYKLKESDVQHMISEMKTKAS